MTLSTLTPADLWYEHGDERHRIVAIEYQHRRPFSVVTEEHWDHSGQPWFRPEHHKATGTCCCQWDFEWSRRYRTSYYHMSGSGGELALYVAGFCEPQPPPGELWVADGIPVLRNSLKPKRIKSDDVLLRMGYRRLKLPRLLTAWDGTKTRNPFEIADEGECVYCKLCDDWFLEDSHCEHMHWCDGCGMFVYTESREIVDSTGLCECTEEDQ